MEKDFDKKIFTSRQQLVRLATEADLPQIAHIARVTWDATYNKIIDPENRREFLARAYKPESLADSLGAPGHWFYVAEKTDQVIGFGHFLQRYHPRHSRAELVRLYILPEYQYQGLGTFILKTGFNALAQAKIEQCFVSVQSTNLSARNFYEGHGFAFYRSHGQFLGTQIITMAEYVRPINEMDLLQ